MGILAEWDSFPTIDKDLISEAFDKAKDGYWWALDTYTLYLTDPNRTNTLEPAWHSVMSILSGPVQRPTDCGEYGFQEDGPAPFEDSELEQVIKDARVWLKTDTQKTYEKFIKSDEFLMDLLLSASFCGSTVQETF